MTAKYIVSGDRRERTISLIPKVVRDMTPDETRELSKKLATCADWIDAEKERAQDRAAVATSQAINAARVRTQGVS